MLDIDTLLGAFNFSQRLYIISLLIFIVNVVHTINIGVIVDNAAIPDVDLFINSTFENITREFNTNRLNWRIFSKSTAGCDDASAEIIGAAIALKFWYEYDVDVLFGPMCYSDLRITSQFSRTARKNLQFHFWNDYYDEDLEWIFQISTASSYTISANLRAFLGEMKWKKVSFICDLKRVGSEKDTRIRVENFETYFAKHNIEVIATILLDNEENLPGNIADMLLSKRDQIRILVLFFGYSLLDYVEFMRGFWLTGLDIEEYPIIIVLPVNIGKYVPPWIYSNGTVDLELKLLFRGCVILVNEFYDEKAIEWTISNRLSEYDESQKFIHLSLYEALWSYMMLWVEQTHFNSSYAESSQNVTKKKILKGPFGDIVFNSNNLRISAYTVIYISSNHKYPLAFMNITIHESCTKYPESDCTWLKGHLMNFTLPITRNFPGDEPLCGFRGEYCHQSGLVMIVIGLGITTFFITAALWAYRRIKRDESKEMPWAIPNNLIKFVDVGSCSLVSIRSQRQPQTDGSLFPVPIGKFRKIATIEQGYVITESYILTEELVFDKADMALLYQMKQTVHDNINPFLGICFDKKPYFYAVWNHCFRGSLADLIQAESASHANATMIMDNTANRNISPFDQNVKSAFVRDIIRGLEWLHSSKIEYQGGLTPAQCLIDSHWILKISGYRMSHILFKWCAQGSLRKKFGNPIIPNSELHYYSPEMRPMLRVWKEHARKFTAKQGRAADMYSFGIIIYEIIFARKVVDTEDSWMDATEVNAESNIYYEAAEVLIPVRPLIPIQNDVHSDLVKLMLKCWEPNIEHRPDASLARKITAATLKITGSLVDQMIKNLEQYTNNLANLVKERTSQLEEAQQHADRLLSELLPTSIAEDLKLGRPVNAKRFKSATVLYSDIVGFTSLCSESEPMQVVNLLSGIFQGFDKIISQHNCYKVETIGDAYMVASGVPVRSRHIHVRDIASVAIMQRDFLSQFEVPHRPRMKLHCRWGFNTGPVFAGVVGLSAPKYCVFGSTATLASKMENSGMPNRIQMTVKSQQLLTSRYPEFKSTPRGSVRIEGIGTLLTYWLNGCEKTLQKVEIETQMNGDVCDGVNDNSALQKETA